MTKKITKNHKIFMFKKQFAKKKPAPRFPSDRVSEVVLARSHGGRSFLRLRYVDGRTDGRTDGRVQENEKTMLLARSLAPTFCFGASTCLHLFPSWLSISQGL
jgi:hypothetical protein